MSLDAAVWILLSTAIVLANVPWILQNKLFVFITVHNKNIWINLGEWFLYYWVMGGLSYLLQNKVMGHVKDQSWEFYVVTLFMFAIFAFPGFIYRYNLKQFIHSSKKSA